jgi:hypothetical protein
MVWGSSFFVSAVSGGEIHDAEHRAAARRHNPDLDGGSVGGAGQVGRGLVRHPQKARYGLRLRPHFLVRIGAIQQHHRLVVLVDRGDHATNICTQSHVCVSPGVG